MDIVSLGFDQKVSWVIEVKWSDRYLERPRELRSLIGFCHAQNLPGASVTSMTSQGSVDIENVTLRFMPASLYCYILGYNLLHQKSLLEGLSIGKVD